MPPYRNRSLRFAPFSFRIERAFSASFPQRQHVAGFVAATTPGKIEQRAVKGGAIVVRQLNQAGFLDQPAQLNQVARSFATLHDPAPAIRSPFRRFRPQRCRPVQSQRPIRRLQQRQHLCARAVERKPRPSRAMPPSRLHPSIQSHRAEHRRGFPHRGHQLRSRRRAGLAVRLASLSKRGPCHPALSARRRNREPSASFSPFRVSVSSILAHLAYG
ncbi:hypothetical protein SPHINGOT1_610023 [Sphingomonas sp. T1]|nr:hypothetical protein SPHINGOT1_610023 [Sphingomonas sp. T1]